VLMLSYVPLMIGVVSLVVWAVTVGVSGAVVSMVTLIDLVVVLPAGSVLFTWMFFMPSVA